MRLSRHPYVAAAEGPPAAERRRDVRNQILDGRAQRGRRRLQRVQAADGRAPAGPPDGAPPRAGSAGLPGARCKGIRRRSRALYEDILIHVTSFFRDPEVFEALKSQILPAILKDKPDGAPIRIWVAGCSTGEEVYSLAIALLEFLGDSSRTRFRSSARISASRSSTRRAPGSTPTASLRDVSDERRRRFFVKVDRGYRINKTVRDLCVFVQHDLARDPPFSKLDLVSCRNVLIYFDQALQKRVMPSLHYALNQPGYPAPRPHREHLRLQPAVLGRRQGEQDLRAHGARRARCASPPGSSPRRVERPAAEPDPRTQVSRQRSTSPSTSTACCWPATRRRASSSTSRWRSSSSAARPARFCSRRPESRRTTSSRWRAPG